MKWFIINFLFAIVLLWPVEYWFLTDLSQPLIFTGVFCGAFTSFWLITWFLNRKHFYQMIRFLDLIRFFIRETVRSNFRVAYDIITPGFIMKPAIIAVPLDISDDLEILALAVAVTLTPGTLVLDISRDKKIMYVHEMYVPDDDPEAVKKNIKEGFEKKILKLSE